MIKHADTILKLIQRRDALMMGFPTYAVMKKITGLQNDALITYNLRTLRSEGYIEKNGFNSYSVTPKGMAA